MHPFDTGQGVFRKGGGRATPSETLSTTAIPHIDWQLTPAPNPFAGPRDSCLMLQARHGEPGILLAVLDTLTGRTIAPEDGHDRI